MRKSAPPARLVAALGWSLVACGALARVGRYLANRSLWGDEGSLAINLLERGFAGLAAPLAHEQAAPLGFLWLERAILLALGESEYALRLLPLLASLAALPLFWRTARELLEPAEALLALALFVASEPLVFYASEFKPYSSDVLVALAILLPALRILRCGASRTRLAWLGIAGVTGPWLSLPAVFLCGGAGLAVAGALSAQKGPRAALPALALASAWLASFAAEYLLVLRPLRSSALLAESWKNHYAPLPFSAEALGWWGRTALSFFHDPLGLPASALAALLFAIGGLRLARRAPRATAALLAPIGLVLGASLAGLHPFPTSRLYPLAARHYPFTGRLLLFCVPLALPAVAAGAFALVGSRDRIRRVLGIAAAAVLLAAPARQLVVNLADPPHIHELRPLLPRLRARMAPGDRIFAQQYATGVVAYYARRAGLGPLAGELALESPRQLPAMAFALRELAPGDRFWIVTLHHPHWRSEAERDAIGAALAPLADRPETLEGERAEASLWRVREARPGRGAAAPP